LRKKHILRIFENRVVRRIFGPKGDDITREWRRLRTKELHAFNLTPNIFMIKSEEYNGVWNVWGRGDAHAKLW
jgi:hypothetical protein